MTLPLDALSPLEGRYCGETRPLAERFSERALIRQRLLVEIEWLKTLLPLFSFSKKTPPSALDILSEEAARPEAADEVKRHEQSTRHDVKAAEYWLRGRLRAHDLSHLQSLAHFGCTSWDINNLAMGRMIAGASRDILQPSLENLLTAIAERAETFADMPMLARTHGQPASTTTVGKEFANFHARLLPRLERLREWRLAGKMNGATGNYNAHHFARPDVDWPALSREFVEKQGMRFSALTTQIEPYDDLADWFNLLRGIDNILLDFCRDMWGYIALDYFVSQRKSAEEVGSSTMPHKINPIDFENAEGNLGIANAFFSHFADKLPVSRWQRDLSDSTVLRSIGAALGHALLAWRAAGRGLERVAINPPKMEADLDGNWQLLAEATQAALRTQGVDDDNADENSGFYKELKNFTDADTVNQERFRDFVESLPLSAAAKKRLSALSPRDYCGLAAALARLPSERR